MTGILYAALVLFGLTTVMGLYLSSLVLRNKETPKAVILIHGLITIAGFILLFFLPAGSFISIVLFAVATLFGLVLLYQDLTGKKFSKWLCFAHAMMTIAGMVFLGMLAYV